MRTVAVSIQTNLLTTFPPNRSYSDVELSQQGMPQEIAHFLSRTLTRRLDFELERLTSDWFDFDTENVARAIEVLREALAPTARIPAGEWETTLLSATRAVLSYLVRPTHTLTGFVFGPDQKELPADVALRRMTYFVSYPFLYEILSQHLHRKQVQLIEKDTFLDLLTQADRMMVQDFSPIEWRQHFAPLSSLVMQYSNHRSGVPFHFLRAHFADKGLDDALQKITLAYQNRGITEFSPEVLVEVLSSDLPSSDIQNPAVRSFYRAEPKKQPAEKSERHSSIPLWKQFRQPTVPTATTHIGKSKEASDKDDPFSNKTTDKDRDAISASGDGISNHQDMLPLDAEDVVRRNVSNQNTGSKTEIPKPPELPRFALDSEEDDLKMSAAEASLFGRTPLPGRRIFIRHLFNNDLSAYVRVLQKLNAARDWKQASDIIANDVFSVYEVNIYSEEAVAFTDAVQDSFGNFRHS